MIGLRRRLLLLCLCVLLVGAPGASRALPLLLSEVLYDASGSDDGKVFVELYGPAGLDLAGLALEGVNGADGSLGPRVALSGVVPSDGFFVVADGASGLTSVAQADLVLDFDFQNGPDSIVLRDPNGAALDALGYGEFAPGETFAGEGQPAPDPPAGHSLARRFADVDSDDNAADFVALADPTPGSGPTQVPEPAPALLVAAACLVLAGLRRRR
jgi:hypothetical protein